MLYRIILPILAPNGDFDVCAKARAVCTVESGMKIMIPNNTRINVVSIVLSRFRFSIILLVSSLDIRLSHIRMKIVSQTAMHVEGFYDIDLE